LRMRGRASATGDCTETPAWEAGVNLAANAKSST
jgi:hypothetical protein